MSVYGHALFWSSIACVLAAVVVCTLVLRYGFTRDSDPAGRWGWRPTRTGHGIAAALFGTGVVLAILALTAVPLSGKEGYPLLGDTLRARLEALRGRLGAFEDVMARLSEEGVRRILSGETRQARATRVERTHSEAAAAATARSTAPSDIARVTVITDGRRAVVGMPPSPPQPQPVTTVEPRPAQRAGGHDRRGIQPDPRDVVAIDPPAAPPAPVELAPPSVRVSPPALPTVSDPRAVARSASPAAASPARERAQAHDRDDDVKAPDKRDSEGRQEKDDDRKLGGAQPKSERPQPGKPEQPLTPDKPTPPERSKPDRIYRAERAERMEQTARLERPERAQRLERIERPERIERIERPERIEKVEKIEKFERPERGGKR